MRTSYTLSQWWLFKDRTKRNPKCNLTQNGNKLASMPIGYLTQMKEAYKNKKTILDTNK